jgi:Tfp pilus assembly protein PilX
MCSFVAGKRPKGAALYLVIGTLIVVSILATVILSLVLNQTTISRHHSTRIQAYYAAQAGMNYALEMLRIGPPNGWTLDSADTDHTCTPAAPCTITDAELPAALGAGNQQFSVVFCPRGVVCAPSAQPCSPPEGYDYCINISVKYTSPNVPTD